MLENPLFRHQEATPSLDEQRHIATKRMYAIFSQNFTPLIKVHYYLCIYYFLVNLREGFLEIQSVTFIFNTKHVWMSYQSSYTLLYLKDQRLKSLAQLMWCSYIDCHKPQFCDLFFVLYFFWILGEK